MVPYTGGGGGVRPKGIFGYLRERLSSASRGASTERERGGARSAAATPEAARKKRRRNNKRRGRRGEREEEEERYEAESGGGGGGGASSSMGASQEGQEGRAEIVRYRCSSGGGGRRTADGDEIGPLVVTRHHIQSDSGGAGGNNHEHAPTAASSTSSSKPEVIRHHVTPLTTLPQALAQELKQAKQKAVSIVTASSNGEVAKAKSLDNQEDKIIREKRSHLQSQKSLHGVTPPQSRGASLEHADSKSSTTTASAVTAASSMQATSAEVQVATAPSSSSTMVSSAGAREMNPAHSHHQQHSSRKGPSPQGSFGEQEEDLLRLRQQVCTAVNAFSKMYFLKYALSHHLLALYNLASCCLLL